MEFDPNNSVVRLCVQGMATTANGNTIQVSTCFASAWENSANDFERFLAAYFVAGSQNKLEDKLLWFERSLSFAESADSLSAQTAFPTLYGQIAGCYEALGNVQQANRFRELAEGCRTQPNDTGPFYHGTRANLAVGDLLSPGVVSNYEPGLVMNHIYFTALVNGAGLAAALARGDGPERVYIVEPVGAFENDPNVTDKKFPGNQTRSYRSTAPLKIVGETLDWNRLTPEQLQHWHDRLANNMGTIIN
jgi:rifampin ADP-ribosylating transferase